MLVTTFAAIHIGTYEVNLEVFEISKKYGIKSIDTVTARMELAKDTYTQGRISLVLQQELIRVLADFTRIMREYHVQESRVVATSSFREADNSLFLIEKIRQMTGLHTEILSNSEQRFLGYKAIASMEKSFNKLIEKGTAIIDLDGGSIQISLFDKDALIATQNIRMGNLRIREMLLGVSKETIHYEQLVSQLLRSDLLTFGRMFLKGRKIENIMMIGDFFTDSIFQTESGKESKTISKENFLAWYDKIIAHTSPELAALMGIPEEYSTLLLPSIVIYKLLVELLGADLLWTPGTHIGRGLAYEYAEEKKLIRIGHDFDNDILMAARNIGKRFLVDQAHAQQTEWLALSIFDATKKLHGLRARGRLLLQISCVLIDVGKYISLSAVGETAYNMIMANEIIGLSHRERRLVASVVKAANEGLPAYQDTEGAPGLSSEEYLKAATLTTILSLAAAMDRSCLQKVKEIGCTLKEGKLRIKLEVNRDYTLEEGLLGRNLEQFGERFGVEVLVRVKRQM